jgi:hypothetical protein
VLYGSNNQWWRVVPTLVGPDQVAPTLLQFTVLIEVLVHFAAPLWRKSSQARTRASHPTAESCDRLAILASNSATTGRGGCRLEFLYEYMFDDERGV